ncbi:hypothetical protein ACFFGH_24045 [Lysobacter korlensis]|uniref:Lipoprotein n=1 Tax=Lysobacter korlensis TaxID=553636 RepID=A0ABV6RVB2_9GAMM
MNKTTALSAVLLSSLIVPLTGCAALMDQLENEASTQFDSTADLEKNWGKAAPWLPSDATGIQTHESTAGDPAILSAKSVAPLEPSVCAETERHSAPAFQEEWSPSNVFVDRVYACGDWTVIPTEDGWFGWTPNDPDEKAASPAS